ncbi:Reverse transcriptase zinc-binding domain [Arabidopsis thaliana x Arabidopsis arenosa]|uniref:Reverse transcriptase zinc-binding domain n=1 Tax=Arabidopsis thaliana x Arabidopsis arenosa TaxID=1240361 RepID=A0A8T2B021_9BRAS|nr:Reverse transcriptase zinc-binding domain [Arabidopsis thaliana x Arabidopsis arenosa]
MAEIWQIKSAPKIKFFLWKAMRNALPIGENLSFRGINTYATCPNCGLEETITHLFFLCSFAKQVWEIAPFHHLPIVNLTNPLRTVIETSKRLICLPPVGISDGPLFPWILWTIWTSRNKKISENRQATAPEVISQSIAHAKEWMLAERQYLRLAPKESRLRLLSLISRQSGSSRMPPGELSHTKRVLDGH